MEGGGRGGGGGGGGAARKPTNSPMDEGTLFRCSDMGDDDEPRGIPFSVDPSAIMTDTVVSAARITRR